jgi:post-segregation antitoxin (ccd killing protein)
MTDQQQEENTERLSITLPVDLLDVVKAVARALGISLSAAARLLIKRGAENSPEVKRSE